MFLKASFYLIIARFKTDKSPSPAPRVLAILFEKLLWAFCWKEDLERDKEVTLLLRWTFCNLGKKSVPIWPTHMALERNQSSCRSHMLGRACESLWGSFSGEFVSTGLAPVLGPQDQDFFPSCCNSSLLQARAGLNPDSWSWKHGDFFYKLFLTCLYPGYMKTSDELNSEETRSPGGGDNLEKQTWSRQNEHWERQKCREAGRNQSRRSREGKEQSLARQLGNCAQGKDARDLISASLSMLSWAHSETVELFSLGRPSHTLLNAH